MTLALVRAARRAHLLTGSEAAKAREQLRTEAGLAFPEGWLDAPALHTGVA